MLAFKDAALGREMKAFAFQIKATGEDGSVEGYGSVFDVEDSYSDVIVKGAFEETIKAHKAAGTMPAMLWQHDAEHPIGVWTEMSEDAKGLKLKGMIDLDVQKGREAYSLLKKGALRGLSIGFVSKGWSYDEKTGIRTLSEIDLWEVSIVTFPANPKATTTSVKAADVAAITTIRQAEKALRDAGFSDDAAKAFVASVKRIANDEREAREAEARIQLAADKLLNILSK